MLFAVAARANSVSDQLIVGVTQANPQNPRTGSISDLLRATFDVGEQWTVTADAQITFEEPAGPPSGTPISFQERGGMVADFSASVDWEVTENWTLGGTLGFSPRSTTSTVVAVTVTDPSTGRPANAEGLIRITNDSAYAELLAGYDTAGESPLEWSFTAALALNRFETLQRLEAAQIDRGGLILVNEVRASAELRSARLSGGATATLFGDTDLSLNLDYYAYADDPRSVGYFSVGGAARTGSAGAGVPIAPLHYLVRPEVAHRFGSFSLKLWAQGGRYMPGTGEGTTAAGVKAQYKFTRWFRAWAGVSGQKDVDSARQSTLSGTFTVGAAYRF
ncbi:MAG: hypothetical protein ACJ79H_19570 [Myxococcales bacterium]